MQKKVKARIVMTIDTNIATPDNGVCFETGQSTHDDMLKIASIIEKATKLYSESVKELGCGDCTN